MLRKCKIFRCWLEPNILRKENLFLLQIKTSVPSKAVSNSCVGHLCMYLGGGRHKSCPTLSVEICVLRIKIKLGDMN